MKKFSLVLLVALVFTLGLTAPAADAAPTTKLLSFKAGSVQKNHYRSLTMLGGCKQANDSLLRVSVWVNGDAPQYGTWSFNQGARNVQVHYNTRAKHGKTVTVRVHCSYGSNLSHYTDLSVKKKV